MNPRLNTALAVALVAALLLTGCAFVSNQTLKTEPISAPASSPASGPVNALAQQLSRSRTPLLDAIAANQIDTVQRLLAEHVDPNQCDSKGATALHHAVREKKNDILLLLLKANADPSIGLPKTGEDPYREGNMDGQPRSSWPQLSIMPPRFKCF